MSKAIHSWSQSFAPLGTALLVGLLFLCNLPVAAGAPGSASGRAVYEGTGYPMSYSLATEGKNEFTGAKEITVILSDLPLAAEDVADDWIEHDLAHFTITLDGNGRALYAQLHYSYSMVGAPDGLSFEGKIDPAAHRVTGKASSGGVVDVYGSSFEYDFSFDAPLTTLVLPGPPTQEGRAAADKSPQNSVFQRLVKAIADEDPAAISGAISAGYLERAGGEGIVQYSISSDVPSEAASAIRVTEGGDRSRLYLETGDQNGIVVLAREQGSWRIDRQKWSYK